MKLITAITILIVFIASSCTDQSTENNLIIGYGEMPNVVKDSKGDLHIVYGTGDSIMYSFSSNGGKTFSSPELISVLPQLMASHTRGPQIAATSEGLILIACNSFGDIFSYNKTEMGKWKQTAKLNDVDTVAKEALMALSADRQNAFAVWLDLRGDKHNKIFGAKSNDGGITWSKNILVYASPDTTVCECCKPSVVMKGNDVYVMFRNWLNGNRDLYLAHSSDGGNTFVQAQKLGNESWTLNGCPMDGGGLALNKNGKPETVWRRHNEIYACEHGQPERKIGEGRSCTIESVNGKNVYAWTENGEVIILKTQGVKKNLGKGAIPVIKSINNEQIICVWEKESEIHSAVLKL
ncbi:MAG: sialidase family protein [Ginsengibacter sp.]